MKTTLTDEDEMPYGKHKGKKMANVPAEYLIWLSKQPTLKRDSLFYYIEENMDVLLEEVKRENLKSQST